MDTVERKIQGETLAFLPEKAVHWKRCRTLMVADLHWGKAEIFQQAGIPVSSAILWNDLNRLKQLVTTHAIERLIVLGDLIHGKQGLTAEVRDTVANWRRTLPVEILLIKGNHDRQLEVPEGWELTAITEPYEDGPFVFRHHPEHQPSAYTWCGHLHPVVHVGSRRDRLRLPCFWLQQNCGILPSFGTFTGGCPIRPLRRDGVLAIADETVVCLQ